MDRTSKPLWLEHTGPHHWFTLSAPPSWTLDAESGALCLTAPDDAGSLTVSSFWRAETEAAAPLDRFIDLATVFPARRKVRPLRPLPDAPQSIGFEGEAAPHADAPWWKRLFARRNWRRFRLWCLRRGSVHVLALFMAGDENDREIETLAGMVLDTLEFAAVPALPPELFAQQVMELCHTRFPLLACEQAGPAHLKIGNLLVNLSRFYRAYQQTPDQFEDVVLPVLATVVRLNEWGPSRTTPNLDDIRDQIMPMLHPERSWREQSPDLVGAPWVGGLCVMYVIDDDNAYWYISRELLERWQIPLDELHELALRNLDDFFERQPMELTLAEQEDGPRLLLPSGPGPYNTTRLLSARFHGKLRDLLGSDFAVGVPSRDFFVALTLNVPDAVETVRSRVEIDYRRLEHPLSDQLLFVTWDGVTEYAPDTV